MADPTRADLVRASELWWNLPSADIDRAIQQIAQALADERERASVAGAHDAGHGDGDGGREGEPVDPADH